MIPADCITFDGDTAWWVPFDDEFGTHVLINTLHDEDRPCDACGGAFHSQGEWSDERCQHCIDGRHTFDIEYIDGRSGFNEVKHLRVSIVPGMVLPIVVVDGNGYPHPKPERFAYVTPKGVLRVVDCLERTDTHSGQSPSAAAPGMWAVQLRMAS